MPSLRDLFGVTSDLLGYADPRLLGMIAGGTGGGIALNKLLQLQAPER